MRQRVRKEKERERTIFCIFWTKRANSRLLEFYRFPTYMDALPLPHFQSSFLYLLIFSSLSFSPPFLCIFFFSHSFSRIYSLLFILIWILNKFIWIAEHNRNSNWHPFVLHKRHFILTRCFSTSMWQTNLSRQVWGKKLIIFL